MYEQQKGQYCFRPCDILRKTIILCAPTTSLSAFLEKKTCAWIEKKKKQYYFRSCNILTRKQWIYTNDWWFQRWQQTFLFPICCDHSECLTSGRENLGQPVRQKTIVLYKCSWWFYWYLMMDNVHTAGIFQIGSAFSKAQLWTQLRHMYRPMSRTSSSPAEPHHCRSIKTWASLGLGKGRLLANWIDSPTRVRFPPGLSVNSNLSALKHQCQTWNGQKRQRHWCQATAAYQAH